MKLKVGQILIAKKNVYMQSDPRDICLKKNHKYKINELYEDSFVIHSEIYEGHYWESFEVDKYFTNSSNILNKNIQIL